MVNNNDPALSRSEVHPEKLWDLISRRLQDAIPRQSYLTWFKPLHIAEATDTSITIAVPSRFYYDWIEGHYSNLLRDAAHEAIGRVVTVRLTVDTNIKQQPAVEPTPPFVVHEARDNGRTASGFETHLNPTLTFDNFIEGDCNKFARAAAVALANAPGKTPFNPLMIFGGSGLGKTHLVQAIGNYIVDKKLAKRVLYITSDQFTADFVNAIQQSSIDSFNRLYRSVDVLLLDDVHFFMAKDKTQEQFFHTFNALHHSGKQLVFSSDRPPRELDGFDERLVSRLQWGLISELKPPELETRLAIIRNIAEINNAILPDEVINLLAVNITDNVRTLQGALIQLIAQTSLLKREISLNLAKDILSKVSSRSIRQISVDKILEIVSREYTLTSDNLRSKTRKKEIAEARQVAMFLCTEYTRLTLKAIGLHFGGRDHATVIHARETISERIKTDIELAAKIDEMRRRLDLASL